MTQFLDVEVLFYPAARIFADDQTSRFVVAENEQAERKYGRHPS